MPIFIIGILYLPWCIVLGAVALKDINQASRAITIFYIAAFFYAFIFFMSFGFLRYFSKSKKAALDKKFIVKFLKETFGLL